MRRVESTFWLGEIAVQGVKGIPDRGREIKRETGKAPLTVSSEGGRRRKSKFPIRRGGEKRAEEFPRWGEEEVA